jgi:hypothetical protein
MKLNLSNCSGFKDHRAGWSFCINALKLHHSNSGIYVDDFIERSFSWELKEYYLGKNKYKLPYKFDWIGFLHNPPNSPDWFDKYNNPASIIKRKPFLDSLQRCRAIVVLSDYLKDWVEENIPVKVPVISVMHPTEIPALKWSYRDFLNNKKKVVQIGYWLRNFDSICNLKVPNSYYKYWMPSNHSVYPMVMKNFEANQEKGWAEVKNKWANTEVLGRISNIEYDKLLSSSIGFCDFYDASANNAVVECVARNTPLLVNRIPATEQYLGPEYPFYFNDLNECFDKLSNNKAIKDCHDYLRCMNKEWINAKYFSDDLMNKLKRAL